MQIKLPNFPRPSDILKEFDGFCFDYDDKESFWCDVSIFSSKTEVFCLLDYAGAVVVKDSVLLEGDQKSDYFNAYKKLIKQVKDDYRQWVYENILEGYGIASDVCSKANYPN